MQEYFQISKILLKPQENKIFSIIKTTEEHYGEGKQDYGMDIMSCKATPLMS